MSEDQFSEDFVQINVSEPMTPAEPVTETEPDFSVEINPNITELESSTKPLKSTENELITELLTLAEPELLPEPPLSQPIVAPEVERQDSSNYSPPSNSIRTLTMEEVSENQVYDEDNDYDFEDENFVERLVGLTEMFPVSFCKIINATTQGTISGVQGFYSLTRSIMWFAASTCVICFLPLMLELERCQVEEQEAVEHRTMMLGPQASHGASGLAGFSANIPVLSPVTPH